MKHNGMEQLISWDDLIQICLSMSVEEVLSDRLEKELRNVFSRVDPADDTLNGIFQNMAAEPIVEYRTHMLLENSACNIMLILLQAGGEVGLHNHPRQHGFIYCYRGSVLIEAFEERSATEREALLVRGLHATLRSGDSAFLTPEKHNIHRLLSDGNVCLVDVFVPPLREEDIGLCRRYEPPYEELGDGLCKAKIIPPPA